MLLQLSLSSEFHWHLPMAIAISYHAQCSSTFLPSTSRIWSLPSIVGLLTIELFMSQLADTSATVCPLPSPIQFVTLLQKKTHFLSNMLHSDRMICSTSHSFFPFQSFQITSPQECFGYLSAFIHLHPAAATKECSTNAELVLLQILANAERLYTHHLRPMFSSGCLPRPLWTSLKNENF